MSKERLKELMKTVDKINKDFGEGTAMMLSEKPLEVEVISTGSLGLDIATGIGGYAKGRTIEIFGPESSGKTTLAIHAIAECQKQGGNAVIIDAEHAFDRNYAVNLGVDVDNLIICQPDYGEQGLEVAEKLISSGTIDIIVIDSVAALTPKGEIEGEMGDAKMGLQARMMGQALRKLTATVAKNNVICIFINQLREKIGIMFGNPETTSGGNALKFYASMRLDVRKKLIKDGDEINANEVKVKVIKNKLAPPFKSAIFNIVYGEGIDRNGELVDMGVELGIINKAGSWYSYNDTKLGQGKDKVVELFKDNVELAEDIEKQIKAKINE